LDKIRTYSISEIFWLDMVDFTELQKIPIAWKERRLQNPGNANLTNDYNPI
jgi:uncharacterized protein (UPF0261 family)